MPKSMRLIDAGPIEAELERLRGIAERRGDARAVATLEHVSAMIGAAPEIPLMVDTERIREEKIKKKPYGEYKNVMLSDTELEKLRERYPSDWEDRIEAVSAHCEAKKKTYKNYAAVIRQWDLRDAKNRRGKEADKPSESAKSFDTDDTLQAALQRTYGG